MYVRERNSERERETTFHNIVWHHSRVAKLSCDLILTPSTLAYKCSMYKCMWPLHFTASCGTIHVEREREGEREEGREGEREKQRERETKEEDEKGRKRGKHEHTHIHTHTHTHYMDTHTHTHKYKYTHTRVPASCPSKLT